MLGLGRKTAVAAATLGLLVPASALAAAAIEGTGDGDRLRGTPGPDQINGNGGDDRIFGLAGDDMLNGGDGADRLRGGSGNDTLDGGTGNDRLRGGSGNDTLDGGDGDDRLRARDGVADRITCGPGNDRAKVDLGLDVIVDASDADPDGSCERVDRRRAGRSKGPHHGPGADDHGSRSEEGGRGRGRGRGHGHGHGD